MPKCAVKRCFGRKLIDIVCYPLPQDVMLRQRWLEACDINNTNVKSIKICSLHFQKSDFNIERISSGRTIEFKKALKKSAIPNINRLKRDASRIRTQKREIRSYVLATQRRFLVNANLGNYSIRKISNLALSSCRYSSLFEICEKDNEIAKLKAVIRTLKRKNDRMKIKYKYWKKLAKRKIINYC